MKIGKCISVLLVCFTLAGCQLSSETNQQVNQKSPSNVPVKQKENYMVVKKQAFVYPTTNEGKELFPLEVGKVVKVEEAQEEWYQIEFFPYAEPIEGEKWVKKEALAEYDPQLVKEGYLKQDALIYDEQGIVKEKGQRNIIFIVGEKGDLYEINAPGGIWGFIRKSDFEPNPFRKFDDGEVK
ncbi:hypothetical protein [Brevibacillus sp. SYSU BS000544]|uniref:hypothetical protein n=1 Tax=Brevibacillus sp. SYSU BS000544 TaxID=3416443 RepID=UPI003CE4AFA1